MRTSAFIILAALTAMAFTQVRARAGTQAQAISPSGQRDLDPERFSKEIATGNYQLIDVRTPKEFSTGHIAGAVNIDWTAADYEAAFSRIDANRPLLLYCHGGGRSEQALEYLLGKGYRAQHLDGGISAWRKAGLPEVR